MDVDGDEDDLEALREMGVVKGETTAEAKVRQGLLTRTCIGSLSAFVCSTEY